MKKLISIAYLVLGMSWGQAHAGIPVFDASNLAQQIQQVAAWAQQYAQMAQQLQQMADEYAAMTGGRGFSTAYNNASYQAARRTLPTDAQQVLDLMTGTGSYGGFNTKINAILSATSSLTNSDFASSTAATQYDESLKRAATNNALSAQAYTDATQRLDVLEGLIGQISTTSDPKAIAELQARIQAENGIIQNEHAKLQAMQMLMASTQQLQAMKGRQTSVRMGGNINNVPRVTVTP
jgi:type IV secretion system protein VirB5